VRRPEYGATAAAVMSRRLSSRHGSLFVAGPDLLSLADEVNRNFGDSALN